MHTCAREKLVSPAHMGRCSLLNHSPPSSCSVVWQMNQVYALHAKCPYALHNQYVMVCMVATLAVWLQELSHLADGVPAHEMLAAGLEPDELAPLQAALADQPEPVTPPAVSTGRHGPGLGELPAGCEPGALAALTPLAAAQALLQAHGLAKLLVQVAELKLTSLSDLVDLQGVGQRRHNGQIACCSSSCGTSCLAAIEQQGAVYACYAYPEPMMYTVHTSVLCTLCAPLH